MKFLAVWITPMLLSALITAGSDFEAPDQERKELFGIGDSMGGVLPEHRFKLPGHHHKDPDHHSKAPDHHSKPPEHHSKPPEHHSKAPEKHSKAPEHRSKAPEHRSKAPGHHSKPTGHHSTLLTKSKGHHKPTKASHKTKTKPTPCKETPQASGKLMVIVGKDARFKKVVSSVVDCAQKNGHHVRALKSPETLESLSASKTKKSQIKWVEDEKLKVFLAEARLTDKQVKELKKNPHIKAVVEDKLKRQPKTLSAQKVPGNHKAAIPKREIVKQDIKNQLNFISQEPKIDLKLEYRYDETAGSGATVYVVGEDPSFNKNHPDFADVHKEYLLPEGVNTLRRGGDGHGSCAAGLVVGKKFGVAKKANLVFAPTPKENEYAEDIEVLKKVKDHIIRNHREHNAVINISFGYKELDRENQDDKVLIDEFRKYFETFTDLGVPIVVAAGNDGEDDSFPAIFARSTQHFPKALPIFVVSSVDVDNNPRDKTGHMRGLEFWAHGKVECPNSRGSGVAAEDGTSFAAPQIAGLLAYFMGLKDLRDYYKVGDGTKFVETLSDLTRFLSYERVKDGPKVIYNGIGVLPKCFPLENGKERKDCPKEIYAFKRK